MIYFDVEGGLIGDALCTVPYMLHRAGGKPALVGPDFNAWVWDGLDVQGRLSRADKAPDGAEIMAVKPSSAWQHCFRQGWNWHMAEAHFHQAHMKPVNPFDVPIKACAPLPLRAEYVIAPFSITDHNMNKKWPVEYWQNLILKLGSNVWVVGAESDDHGPFREAGASSIRGATMPMVAQMLRDCKCLISIDTGIGHLGVMLHMKHHVMIYSRQVPARFAETPFGRMVYGGLTRDISVEDVLAAVRGVSK